MTRHIVEYDEVCRECGGSGLYIGMAERDGASVVCHRCEGTGCHHVKTEYDDFETRQEPTKPVRRVFEVNPGIIVGNGSDAVGFFKLPDFGGMSYEEWKKGKPFPNGSENRRFTCPAWWYQTANYELKPHWKECSLAGSFSHCPHFPDKAACWSRFDAEHPELAPDVIK